MINLYYLIIRVRQSSPTDKEPKMKAIIEIIKETIESGKHNVNLANYKCHTEKNLPVSGWVGEVPSLDEVLTNGSQDMRVVNYIVIGDSVGVEMDNGMKVPASQVVDMMAKKICWVK